MGKSRHLKALSAAPCVWAPFSTHHNLSRFEYQTDCSALAALTLSGLKMEMAALMMSRCIIGWLCVCGHSFLAGMFGALETVCRWKSKLCLFSPTWWFTLVRVPEDCQVQSPWWSQIGPHQPCLSSAKSHKTMMMFISRSDLKDNSKVNLFCCLV